MLYIITYKSIKFFPGSPSPSMIDIEDIAHALSLTNRFSGHSKFPLSVARHSINCSLMASPERQMEALLHDATEAYISDISRPTKKLLAEYVQLEANIYRNAIAPAFNLPPVLSKEVLEIDDRMLITESMALLNDYSWVKKLNGDPYPFSSDMISERGWREDESDFLKRYEEIKNATFLY